MEINKYIKCFLLLLLILLFSLYVYKQWFSFSTLLAGDYTFFFSESLVSFLPVSIWKASVALGGVDILVWRTPLQLLWGLFGSFGLDYNVADRFVTLWPWVIFPGISMFFLVYDILRSKTSALIGSLVYIFNTYYLSINTQGHFLISVASSFAVFSLLFFIKFVSKKKAWQGVLSGLFLFICASYDLRVAYLTVGLLFLYLIYYILIIRSRLLSIKEIILAILPFFIFILLSSYWILSLIGSASLTSNEILSRHLFGNEFLDIRYAITLFHPFWTGHEIVWFKVQEIPFYFWLIPIFATLGLFLNKNNKSIIFFGLIAGLGIFLTKQVSIPFLNVYSFLFEYLPGFGAFREASKFYFLIILGYSVLIAGFIDWLWSRWKQGVWRVYVKYLVTVLIALLFMWNTKPVITEEIEATFIKREINSDYLVLKEFILKQPDYFRILWVPRNSVLHINTNNHPEVSAISVINSDWKSLIDDKGNVENNYTDAEFIINFFKQNQTDRIIDLSAIKYIVVPLIDEKNADNTFVHYGKDRSYYINELNNVHYLRKVDIGTKEIVIYENDNFNPHIYETDKQETIIEKIEYRSVEYQYISPAEYRVSLRDVNRPFYLNFSESYHTQWKVRIGAFNWWDSSIQKDYFLPERYHTRNDAKLNSFYINPSEICEEYDCVQNEDGSYDIKMTLYFKPQAYMYLGGIVSLATLVGIIGYLGYYVLRIRFKARKE